MDIAALLGAAANGDQRAWDTLVDRFTGLVWSIARSYRLTEPDAADAVQMTWLRLVENLDRVADPARLPGWLATTVRRECLQIIRRAKRTEFAYDGIDNDLPSADPDVDNALLVAERDALLWQAFDRLSETCTRLLRVLMATRPPSYGDVAAVLEMPVGSIGPTRQRCLRRLRDILQGDGVLGPDWTEDRA